MSHSKKHWKKRRNEHKFHSSIPCIICKKGQHAIIWVLQRIKQILLKILLVNVKCKIIKLLADDLDDLEYSSNFLDTTPKIQSMEEIIDKLGFIKIKNSAL